MNQDACSTYIVWMRNCIFSPFHCRIIELLLRVSAANKLIIEQRVKMILMKTTDFRNPFASFTRVRQAMTGVSIALNSPTLNSLSGRAKRLQREQRRKHLGNRNFPSMHRLGLCLRQACACAWGRVSILLRWPFPPPPGLIYGKRDVLDEFDNFISIFKPSRLTYR